MYTDTILNLIGNYNTSLKKVTNNHGDIYYRIQAKTWEDGKRTCYTTIEYSSEELAREEFYKMTNTNPMIDMKPTRLVCKNAIVNT